MNKLTYVIFKSRPRGTREENGGPLAIFRAMVPHGREGSNRKRKEIGTYAFEFDKVIRGLQMGGSGETYKR